MYLRGRQRKGQTFKLQPFHGQRWWLTQEGWHHIARSSRQCATSLKLTKICAESRKNRRLVTSTEHRQACTLHTSCAAWGGETREASHNFICIKVLRPGLGHITPAVQHGAVRQGRRATISSASKSSDQGLATSLQLGVRGDAGTDEILQDPPMYQEKPFRTSPVAGPSELSRRRCANRPYDGAASSSRRTTIGGMAVLLSATSCHPKR